MGFLVSYVDDSGRDGEVFVVDLCNCLPAGVSVLDLEKLVRVLFNRKYPDRTIVTMKRCSYEACCNT